MAAITLIPGVYQEVLLPKITKAIAEGSVTKKIGQAERYLFILSLLVVVPVSVYANEIVLLLYGERYLPAVFPLQVMLALRAAMILTQGANLTLISKDKQVSMALLNVFLAVLAIGLSFIFVPQWGLNGSLFVYGILIIIQFVGYQYLAKKLGYRMLSMKIALRILASAIIALIPVLIVNYYLSGLVSVFLGSFVFIIFYLNLLFLLKGFDESLVYLLKPFSNKGPVFLQKHLKRCIHCIQR